APIGRNGGGGVARPEGQWREFTGVGPDAPEPGLVGVRFQIGAGDRHGGPGAFRVRGGPTGLAVQGEVVRLHRASLATRAGSSEPCPDRRAPRDRLPRGQFPWLARYPRKVSPVSASTPISTVSRGGPKSNS